MFQKGDIIWAGCDGELLLVDEFFVGLDVIVVVGRFCRNIGCRPKTDVLVIDEKAREALKFENWRLASDEEILSEFVRRHTELTIELNKWRNKGT